MRNKLLSIFFAPLLIIGLLSIQKHAASQTVDFTYYGICVGSPTSFSGTATGFTAVSWSWSFGDGNFGGGQNVSNTYAAPNVLPGYTATLVVKDNLGGTHTVTKFISIQDLPNIFFSYNTPTCNRDSVHFHDLSYTTYGFKRRYVWNFGDGTPNDTINYPNNPDIGHMFPSWGTYNVTLQVMNSDS